MTDGKSGVVLCNRCKKCSLDLGGVGSALQRRVSWKNLRCRWALKEEKIC